MMQIDPNIQGGVPVIKGTRVPVARVMALKAMNYTLAEIKKEIPNLGKLTQKDLREFFEYYAQR